jgi:hypothetical protein
MWLVREVEMVVVVVTMAVVEIGIAIVVVVVVVEMTAGVDMIAVVLLPKHRIVIVGMITVGVLLRVIDAAVVLVPGRLRGTAVVVLLVVVLVVRLQDTIDAIETTEAETACHHLVVVQMMESITVVMIIVEIVDIVRKILEQALKLKIVAALKKRAKGD